MDGWSRDFYSIFYHLALKRKCRLIANGENYSNEVPGRDRKKVEKAKKNVDDKKLLKVYDEKLYGIGGSEMNREKG
jgi:hypothetical protein